MKPDPYAKERAQYQSGKTGNSPMEKFFATLIADAKGERGDTPKKGTDYFTDQEKEVMIKEVVSRIPVPKDGEDADYDIVFSYVVQEVEKEVTKQVAKIPKAKDGEPGKDAVVDIPAIVESLLKVMPKLDEAEDVDYAGIKEYIDKQVKKIKLPTQRVGNIGGGAQALGQLTDVDLSGLTQDAKGNYILGSGGGSSLPDQTGNNGKFLTTDGTDPAWESIPGGGDMAAATYDPDGGAEQVAFASDLGTAAAAATGDFATAAQGTTADSAVQNTGNETVAGVKTFSSSPIVPAPTTDQQAATKKYVDDNGGGGGTVDVVSNVATDTILGRTTAGTGDSEQLTASAVRTLINVEDGATADQDLSGLLPKAGGTMTGNIALNGNYLSGDGGDEGVFVESSGNVGIGTSSPSAKLHIVDGANTYRFNDGARNITPNIALFGVSTKAVALLTGNNGSVFTFDDTGFFGIFKDSKANITGGNSRGGTALMTIKNSGNVGIGTMAPDTLLHNAGAYTQESLSSDPADPDAGNSVQWVSDGTGSGDAGDVLLKVNVGGTTKVITLIDYSVA